MKLEKLIEIVGMAAIIASLIFVGVQLQQDRRIAEVDLLSAISDQSLEFAQLIQADPQLWRRGLAGELLSEDEAIAFDAVAAAMFRMYANQYRITVAFQGLTIGIGASESEREYAYAVYSNPGLRTWFGQLVEERAIHNRAYGLPDEIQYYPRIIDLYLQQLDSSQPALTKTTAQP